MPDDGIYLSQDTYRNLNADLFKQDARSVVADAMEQHLSQVAPDMVAQAQQQADDQQRQQETAAQHQRNQLADQFESSVPELLGRVGGWAVPTSDTPQEAPQAAPAAATSPSSPDTPQAATAPVAAAPAANPDLLDLTKPAPVAPSAPLVTPSAPMGTVAQHPIAATPPSPPAAAQGLVDYAKQAALKAGIDPDLFVRQINTESGFRPAAQSGAGAIGVAQIVPRFHPGVDPTDPYASLDYAANLMASHLKTYGGDIRKALVAYNGGQGAVDALNAGKPYAESQSYLSKILGGDQGTAATSAAPRDPNAILDAAKPFLGQAYVWGGKSPQQGFDCSGLAGYLTTGQAESTTSLYGKSSAVGQDQAQPGDLVFWNMGSSDPHLQHVAVYLGNGQIVQSGGDQTAVNVGSVDQQIGSPPEFRRVGPGGAPAQAAAPAGAPPPNANPDVPPQQTMWDRIGTGISDVFKSVFGGVQSPDTGNPVADVAGTGASAVGSVVHKALLPFGGASEEFPTGGPLAGPLVGSARGVTGVDQLAAEYAAKGGPQLEAQLRDLISRQNSGEQGLDDQINAVSDQINQISNVSQPFGQQVSQAAERNPNLPAMETAAGIGQAALAAPLVAEGAPLAMKAAAAVIDPQTGLPAVAGRVVRSGQPAEASAEFASGGLGRLVPSTTSTVDDLASTLVKPKGSPGVSIEPYVISGKAVPEFGQNVVYRDASGDPQGILTMIFDKSGQPKLLEIAVNPEVQRQGIATGLYDAAQRAGYNVDAASGAGGYTNAGQALASSRAVGRRQPFTIPAEDSETGVAQNILGVSGLGKLVPNAASTGDPLADAANRAIATRLGQAPVELQPPVVPGRLLQETPQGFEQAAAQPSTDTVVGLINWAKDRGVDTSALERQLSFMQKMQAALGGGEPAAANVGLATHLGGAAAGGGAAYLGTDENDPNRILKIAGGAAAGSVAAGFGLSAAKGALNASANAQPMLPGMAGAVSGPELFRAYHTNNVISGLATLTHVMVNSILAPAWSFGTRGIADIAGGAAGLATGGRVGLDTGFSRVQGSGVGVAAGLASAGEDFGAALANHFTNPNSVANRAGGVGGALLNAQSVFGALHGAAMAAAQGIISRTELGRLAGEEATRQGLKGQEWTQAVAQMIDTPLAGMLQEAEATANRAALRGDLGTLGSTMQKIASVPYVGNTLFPVVKIGANALAQGIEKSPLGLLGTGFDVARAAAGKGPYGGASGFAGNGIVSPLSERLTNNIAGTALTAWLATKAMDGTITGDGPSDPGQRAELMTQGWQPNSVYVPGRGYIDYHALGSLATSFALAGSYGDAMKYGGSKSDPTSDPEAIAGSMLKQMAKYLEDSTGMRTIGQIYDIFHTQGPGLKTAANMGTQLGASLLAGFVPMSALDRGIATATDPLARKADPGDLGQALKLGIPGLREQLPVRQDVLGNPEANNQAGLGVFSPRTGTGAPDPTVKMLEDAGVRFPALPAQVPVSSRYAIDLTPDEKLQFQTARGALVQEMLTPIVGDREFAQAPLAKRQQILQRVFQQADKAASKQLVSQIPESDLEQRVIANKDRRAPVGFASP